jgi:hypothetical protein
MATTRRWRGFVFTQLGRLEWRAVGGTAGNLVLVAWPVFNGRWYATITYLSDAWFTNGEGKDFRSALNDAFREMKLKLRNEAIKADELRKELQETEDAEAFYGAAVRYIRAGGRKTQKRKKG